MQQGNAQNSLQPPLQVWLGQWEGKSSWQKPKSRQTHLDLILGPTGAKEEFRAGRDVVVQGWRFTPRACWGGQ